MPTRHTAKIVNIRQLTPDVKHFSLQPEEKIDFKAGQFIKTILQDDAGKEAGRSYSIASTPRDDGAFDLCVKILPGGLGSRVFDACTGGETIQFEGPMGRFVIGDMEKDHVFVAAGVGIAPIRGHLQHLFHNNFKKKATLYFGFHTENDFYYKGEFDELKKNNANFEIIPSASKPQGAWGGEVGRVNVTVKKFLNDAENKIAYACGPPQMVRDIVPILRDKGFERKDIKLDIWEA